MPTSSSRIPARPLRISIESRARTIEVKAVGVSQREAFDISREGGLVPAVDPVPPRGPRLVPSARTSASQRGRRNPHVFVYIVDNVRSGDAAIFGLKVLGGGRLARLLEKAKERRYFEVPVPVAEYDTAPGAEALRK